MWFLTWLFNLLRLRGDRDAPDYRAAEEEDEEEEDDEDDEDEEAPSY